MKRFFTALLIIMMVPLFMGLFCPCAKAAEPVDAPSITKAPCHGCCAEISASPDLLADQIQNSFSGFSFSKASNVLKALTTGSDRISDLSRRVFHSAAGGPLFSPEPLYLVFRTLLI